MPVEVFDSENDDQPSLPKEVEQYKEDGFIDETELYSDFDDDDDDEEEEFKKSRLFERRKLKERAKDFRGDVSPLTTGAAFPQPTPIIVHPSAPTLSPPPAPVIRTTTAGSSSRDAISVSFQDQNTKQHAHGGKRGYHSRDASGASQYLTVDETEVEEQDEKRKSTTIKKLARRLPRMAGITANNNSTNSLNDAMANAVPRTQSAYHAPLSRAGWEPGVSVETLLVPDDYNNPLGCQVTIVDYSEVRHKLWRMEVHSDNDRGELLALLQHRPSWSKVRWINVCGHRGEAVKTIGGFHELHRLAIEDMVFGEGRRTKAEKYPTHTFCCLPLFKLMKWRPSRQSIQKRHLVQFWRDYNRESFAEFRAAERRRSSSHQGNNATISSYCGFEHARSSVCENDEEEEDSLLHSDMVSPTSAAPPRGGMSIPMSTLASRSNYSLNIVEKPPSESDGVTLGRVIGKMNPQTIYHWHNPDAETNVGAMYLEQRRPLASVGKALGIEQVYLVLTENNTVISFFDKGGDRIETPILARIGTDSTILRESSDPSMLLQALIDCIVDEINPIITEYRKRLDELEIAAVMNPTMGHTQDLHLINAELTILRNTIVPITSLVNSLRDHSVTDQSKRVPSEEVESEGADAAAQAGGGAKKKESPSTNDRSTDISELAVVYLADVADHTMTYTQDLDVMRNNAKSMTELIFNTISIQSSDAVRMLSLVTVVFLPLSFLTGYYGMNFTHFDTLDNTVGYYWGIAVPFCVSMTCLLMWQWVRDKIRNTKNSIERFWQGYKKERDEYRRYAALKRRRRATKRRAAATSTRLAEYQLS